MRISRGKKLLWVKGLKKIANKEQLRTTKGKKNLAGEIKRFKSNGGNSGAKETGIIFQREVAGYRGKNERAS